MNWMKKKLKLNKTWKIQFNSDSDSHSLAMATNSQQNTQTNKLTHVLVNTIDIKGFVKLKSSFMFTYNTQTQKIDEYI